MVGKNEHTSIIKGKLVTNGCYQLIHQLQIKIIKCTLMIINIITECVNVNKKGNENFIYKVVIGVIESMRPSK